MDFIQNFFSLLLSIGVLVATFILVGIGIALLIVMRTFEPMLTKKDPQPDAQTESTDSILDPPPITYYTTTSQPTSQPDTATSNDNEQIIDTQTNTPLEVIDQTKTQSYRRNYHKVQHTASTTDHHQTQDQSLAVAQALGPTISNETQSDKEFAIQNLLTSQINSDYQLSQHVKLNSLIKLSSHIDPFHPYHKLLDRHTFRYTLSHPQTLEPFLLITLNDNFDQTYLDFLTALLAQYNLSHHVV